MIVQARYTAVCLCGVCLSRLLQLLNEVGRLLVRFSWTSFSSYWLSFAYIIIIAFSE